MGDLYVNLNNTTAITNKMKSSLSKHGFKVINHFNTRITDASETKIDVILTNKTELFECDRLEEPSDHKTIQIKMSCDVQVKPNMIDVISWRE